MVALVITSIGLLGIAKMQALAYASTGTAASARWSRCRRRGSPPRCMRIAVIGPRERRRSRSSSRGTGHQRSDLSTRIAATAAYCVAGNGNNPCAPATMAANDLRTYAAALNAMLDNSNPVTTINCPAALIGQPTNCTIQVNGARRPCRSTPKAQAVTNLATFSPDLYALCQP